MENPGFEPDDEKDYQTFRSKEGDSHGEVRNRKESASTSTEKISPNDEKVTLKKSIGFFSCIGIVVGSVIGSGIFISPKGVLLGCGSVGFTLIVWLLCGIYSFLGASSFTELGIIIPNSGGQYMYMLECFAPSRKEKKLFWGPFVGFLYTWQCTFFQKPATFVLQSMACATYLVKLGSLDCISAKENKNSETFQIKILSVVILSLVTAINCLSVKFSTHLINVFTVAKVVSLVFIIIGGITVSSQGINEALSTGFEGTTITPSGLAVAFYSGLFAFAGWDNLNLVTREISNPKKNMFRAMMISCTILTVIYLLTNISYFLLLTKIEFLASEAVAVDFGTKFVGKFGGLFMVLSIAFSIFGATTVGTLTAARVTYAAAREGHLCDVVSFLNINTMSPTVSLIVTLRYELAGQRQWDLAFDFENVSEYGTFADKFIKLSEPQGTETEKYHTVFKYVLALFMSVNSSIIDLIMVTGFVDTFFIGVSMVALITLRRTRKDVDRPIRVPIAFPILVLLFSLFLTVTPFVKDPKIEYFFVLVFLFTGFIVYIPFVYFELKIPGLDKITKYIQIFLQVAPPEDLEI